MKPTRTLLVGFAAVVYLGALTFVLNGQGRLALNALALATSALIPTVRDVQVSGGQPRLTTLTGAASICLGVGVTLLNAYFAVPTTEPLLASAYLLALYNLLRGLLIVRYVLTVRHPA